MRAKALILIAQRWLSGPARRPMSSGQFMTICWRILKRRQTRHALSADYYAIDCRLIDEPPAPVLDPGRGKGKKGYFRALARDDRGWNGPEPPGVAFTYAPGRSGNYASQILQGFEGILHAPVR
jgi:hypothetical protein